MSERFGYDPDENIYFDRTRPVLVDGEEMFEEATPADMVEELERLRAELEECKNLNAAALMENRRLVSENEALAEYKSRVPLMLKEAWGKARSRGQNIPYPYAAMMQDVGAILKGERELDAREESDGDA